MFAKIITFASNLCAYNRSPGLFNLIDSVWDNEGFGLLQVQNSQSQVSIKVMEFLYLIPCCHINLTGTVIVFVLKL